jgi:TetR/AcrR family transcriptional regulator, fatty acid metabolism regulator protein
MGQRTTRRTVNRLPPEKRISDIMIAAREIFTEKGYSDSLISDIAERAGVVEGTIYRFFTNKRDLLQRVAEEWFVEMMASDEAAFGAVRGEWNQLRFIVYHHLNSIRRDPGLSRLVIQELRPDPRYRETRLFQLHRDYSNRVVDIVKRGIAAGVFRPDASPTLVRDLVFGGIEHRTWAFMRREGDFDLDATADAITELIYPGLLPRGVSPLDQRLESTAARLEAAADRLVLLASAPVRP